jgi:hypothetical protein
MNQFTVIINHVLWITVYINHLVIFRFCQVEKGTAGDVPDKEAILSSQSSCVSYTYGLTCIDPFSTTLA